MQKFNGFIFDIDGTLTSTNRLIFDTFNFVTKKYLGKTYSDEEIVRFFGPTEDVILKELMKENYEKARRDYYDFYKKNHKKLADVYPGIKEILAKIKKAGKPLGIYTGKGRESSVITLKEIGVYDFFDLIVTGDDVTNHKPSPEGIRKFLKEFSLKPEETLLIGDAPADILAAQSAGIKVASALWDSYAREKVLQMKSDFRLYSVDELKSLIEKVL
jgi:HAD superfamily hydrolase (TIGR01509 family)